METDFTDEQLARFKSAVHVDGETEKPFHEALHDVLGIAFLNGMALPGSDGKVLREDLSADELDKRYKAAHDPIANFETLLDGRGLRTVTRDQLRQGIIEMDALLKPNNPVAEKYRAIMRRALELLGLEPIPEHGHIRRAGGSGASDRTVP